MPSMRTVARLVVVAAFIAACNATPGAPLSSAGPGASVPAQATPAPAPTAGPQAKGSWSVTLTGKKSGAGTYSGTGDVYCSAVSPSGGALQWTGAMNNFSGPISQISLLDDGPQSSILVQTPGGIEGGQWFVSSTTPGAAAQVTGSGDESEAHVSAHGSWSDESGSYSVDVSLDCSDVSL
jgi:hypothetical protein